MSVWLVLRGYRKRIGAARIVRACRHSRRTGCFGIGLALAFHEFGLRVSFYTDPDPAIQPMEARRYEWARRSGIQISPAIGLADLRCRVRRQAAIVYLADTKGEGHFSPLIGFHRGKALLPYIDEERLTIGEFQRRWSGPGFPRQCLLVSVEPSAAGDQDR
jgi:hypothetical protein